jgi:hypothetical protein
MSSSVEYAITVLLIAILGLLVKIYAEHVEDRIKVKLMWREYCGCGTREDEE